MASLAALGATYTDLILNAIFRGSVGTPPTTLYFSLGASGSTLTPVEITTTRTAVKVTRGWLSGQDSSSYPYQSTGTVAGRSNVMHEGFDIYCTGMGANTYTNVCILVYDAASAGNLLAVFEPSWSNIVQLVNEDIVRVGSPLYDITDLGGGFSYNLTLPANTLNYAMLFQRANNAGSDLGAYMYAAVTDWLWRGFDSINSLWPPGTYPNVYINFINGITGAIINDIPRLAVPRSTGAWSAPAYVSPGTNLERRITNSVDFNFGSATGPGSYTNAGIQFRMSNIPQSFDDLLYEITNFPNLTWNTGDNITFAAGQLDIILN